MLVDLREFTSPRDTPSGVPEVAVRRADEADRQRLFSFVAAEFGDRWAAGVVVAYSREPVSAFVAACAGHIVGFACYDIAYLDYFGPMGVREAERGRGIGARLVVATLTDMAERGYAYAVIGDVGPTEFYAKVCGAVVIRTGQ